MKETQEEGKGVRMRENERPRDCNAISTRTEAARMQYCRDFSHLKLTHALPHKGQQLTESGTIHPQRARLEEGQKNLTDTPKRRGKSKLTTLMRSHPSCPRELSRRDPWLFQLPAVRLGGRSRRPAPSKG